MWLKQYLLAVHNFYVFLGVLKKTIHRRATTAAVIDAVQRALNGTKDWEGGRRERRVEG